MLATTLAELDSLIRLHNLSSRIVRRHDENDPYFQILLRLHYTADDRLPQVELADALQLSIPQVQKITEQMQEGERLVVREEGAPRGGMFVKITEAGQKRVQELLSERAHEFGLVERILGDTDTNPVLTRLLEELRKLVTRRTTVLRVAG